MKEFPKTLKAVKTSDGSQWAIGDALIAECGPPSEPGIQDGSLNRLAEAAKYLLSEGYEYATSTLSHFRFTSYAFKSSDRRFEVSYGVYRVAQTPEYLDAIIAGTPKGTKITQNYVEGLRRTQLEKARRERERQAQKAIAEREKAEAEEAAARKKVRETKESEAKKAAEAEAQKAARKTEKAKQKEQETRVAPRPKITPPEPEEVPRLVAEMQFLSHAAHSVVLARQAAKDLRTCLDQLNSVSIAALTDAALEASNAWIDAANLVREQIDGVKEQRGHLSVVGE